MSVPRSNRVVEAQNCVGNIAGELVDHHSLDGPIVVLSVPRTGVPSTRSLAINYGFPETSRAGQVQGRKRLRWLRKNKKPELVEQLTLDLPG
jgi:hypothetical protein